jgi:hypothetical protein
LETASRSWKAGTTAPAGSTSIFIGKTEHGRAAGGQRRSEDVSPRNFFAPLILGSDMSFHGWPPRQWVMVMRP